LTLLADGKASEARTQFKTAGTAATDALTKATTDKEELQRIKIESRVGEGETYLMDKDYKKAESFFRKLAGDSDAALKAAGYAGEGESIFLSAVEKSNANDLRRAQIALANASVLDASSGAASAKANYYLGRCLLALGPDKEGDSFKQRAQAYFDIVITNYPSTHWAGKARTAAKK